LRFTNRGKALLILPECAAVTRVCQVCGLRRALPLALITKAKNGRAINTPQLGGDGSGGGGSAAAKTSELGHDDERPKTALETARREAEFSSRWDQNITWGPAEPLQWATVVGLVDSAREKNKARVVIENLHEPGVIQTLLAPF